VLNGEVVGLIFDGNFHSLVANVANDGRTNRAVAVDIRGMAEAFKTVYNATELLTELGVACGETGKPKWASRKFFLVPPKFIWTSMRAMLYIAWLPQEQRSRRKLR